MNLPILALLGMLLSLSASASESPASTEVDLGTYRNTHYWLVPETDYEKYAKDALILNMSDEIIARVSMKFRKAIDMEGTGKLIDGRVVNYAGKKDGTIRYRVTANPFGDGVGTCPLVPFHSVAVDPTKVPLGSLVRIEETVGMKLPDGSVHDGLWRAEDIGGAIKQDRIDLFVGVGNQGSYLRAAGITHLAPLRLVQVAPPAEDSCVYRSYEDAEPAPIPSPAPAAAELE